MATLKQVSVEKINSLSKNTLMETLNIQCVEVGADYLKSTMPVNASTIQPAGLLHGGASMALIESVGSMGSVLLIDYEKEIPVGLEINANHISSVRSGTVIATGKVIHAGKRTHVWQVDIHHQETNKLICTGRLTVMITPRQ